MISDEHKCAVTDPFVRPSSNLETLHANITDALAELRGARQIHEHSPSAQTQRDIDLCEWRLNHLLARQSATTEKAQV